MRTFRCGAVLLDMDGTLVDSRVAVTAQWGRWAARHGLNIDDILKVSHGRPAIETMRMFAPHAATEAERERFEREEEAHEEGVVAIPGAVEFVKRLPPERWAVVTSAPRELARRRMAAAGFPAPRLMIAPGDVERGKPDPMPYLAAAESLGVAPAGCLVVEDAHAGIEAARAAGMTVIGITTMYTAEELGCAVTIADFTEVEVEAAGDALLVRLA